MSQRSSEGKQTDLKILFVTESYPPESYGGGEISCSLLAEALAERDDVEVSVLTSEIEGEKKLESKDGMKIIRRLKTGSDRSSFKSNLKRRLFFKKSVQKEIDKISHHYDLIHFFNITSITKVSKPSFATINSYLNFCPKGNLFYREESVCRGCNFKKFLGCITNSEYVGNQKNSKLLRYNPVFWIALYLDYQKRNRCLSDVDYFFSLSDFISEMLVESGISPSQITKVPNLPKIEESNEEIEIPEKERIVAYIGGLTKIKGVDLLIRAFKEIETEAYLIVVGDGPERERLEKIAGSSSDILFLGQIEHKFISSVYEKSDIIVVPSVWPEPLSRVLLEAAYFGKPIIATNVGGSSHVVKHNYNGLLVKPEYEDLKEKLKFLLKKDKKREEMEKNMERYYREDLSKEKILEKMIVTYRKRLKN